MRALVLALVMIFNSGCFSSFFMKPADLKHLDGYFRNEKRSLPTLDGEEDDFSRRSKLIITTAGGEARYELAGARYDASRDMLIITTKSGNDVELSLAELSRVKVRTYAAGRTAWAIIGPFLILISIVTIPFLFL